MKLTPYFFTLLLITSFHLLPAQENINELIEEATELSNEANQQVEDGDYEAAAENYEKAAKKFEDAGMPARANAERINAAASYDNAADKARDDEKYASAAKLYGKAAQAYDKAGAAGAAATSRRNKLDNLGRVVVQNAVGTGNTTGHIATITIQNNGNIPLTIAPQTFFIPSDGKHQSYVGSTPSGVTVGIDQTAEIPIHGYCVDIYSPPVGAASPMPSLDSWIPVAPQASSHDDLSLSTPPQVPEPMNPLSGKSIFEETALVLTFGTFPVPAFDTLQISGITNSRGFTPFAIGTEPESPFAVTWPGTVTPIGGFADIDDDPEGFAALLVEIVDRVQFATENLQDSGDLHTPFFGDSQKEKETVTQQSLWRVMGTLTGKEYTEEDFTSKIHTQFEEKMGVSISDLPEEEEEKMNAGVADFWNSFTAVGIEAKVIRAKKAVPIEDAVKRGDLTKLLLAKYTTYEVARALNGKSHREACKDAKLDPDSPIGKAFKRIYDNQ